VTRLFALCAALIAQPLVAQTVRPWTEAVVSVADFAPFEALLVGMGDWQLRHQGDLALADSGPTDMIAFRSPDSAQTEFYEVN